jgi:arylsulfatase A-like enzyme
LRVETVNLRQMLQLGVGRHRAPAGLALGVGEGAPLRRAEVYAGFLSHADHHIGRLLDYLEESSQLENTMVVLVSDNGASGESGANGSVNENKFFNVIPTRSRTT